MASRPSMLKLAMDQNEVKMVAINQVDELIFENKPRSHSRAIGTLGLNACTAVILVSQKAAILAHIALLPPGAPMTPTAGDDNGRAKMQDLRSRVVRLRYQISSLSRLAV